MAAPRAIVSACTSSANTKESGSEPGRDLANATWEGIVGVADELDAAVFVIGSRGLTGLKMVFDAGVSQQVAEHAGRSVLIVPPPR